ncbi:MAG: glycosyltransferase [Muribaculum sp.]|nr:glycosyltransferase [Muribaculum sp.]
MFCDNSLRELLNFRQPVIESYLKDGADVVTLAPPNRVDPHLGEGYRHEAVRMSPGGMNPFADFMYFLRLLRIYMRERPDYIFHYTIKPNIYGTMAARLCGIPSAIMIAGLGYVFTAEGLGPRIGRFLYRIAMRLSDRVMVLNESNRDMLLKKRLVSERKLLLLPGGEGVDLARFDRN